MKVLICVSEYPPYGSGIGNVAFSIVNELRKRGVECIVCSPTGPDIIIGNRKLILKLGRIGLIYYWYKVSMYFKNNAHFDIIWLHQPIFLLKNSLTNCLITIHITSIGNKNTADSGILFYSIFLRLYYLFNRMIEKYSFSIIDKHIKFVVDSPKVGEEVISLRKDIPVKYIPNGVDIEKFKPKVDLKYELRSQFQIPPDKIVFLWIGRLVGIKNPKKLIKVFSIMNRMNNNLFLVIRGDGILKKYLMKFSRSLNLENILFLGRVDEEKLPYLYSCADNYIMTSKYEGLPLTLLEAMASGIPCIVSDIPNLKIVEDAKCGIVVDFSNEEAAAQKIMEYIKKDNSEHARNARKYAEENLDWSKIAGNYLKEFETINNKYDDTK